MIGILKKRLSSPICLPVIYVVFLAAGYGLFISEYPLYFFVVIALLHVGFLGILIRFRALILRDQGQLESIKQDYLEKTNLVLEQIDKKKIALDSYHKELLNYSQLKDLTEQLSQCLTLMETSQTLSSHLIRLFGGEETVVILYLFHARTGELGLSSSQKGQMRINLKSKKGDVFDEWIVKTLQPLLVEDAQNDYRFDLEKNETEEARPVKSLISSPLAIASRTVGILRIDSPVAHYFKTEDLRFLSTVADIGAVAIENAQLFERVEELAMKDGLTGLYLRRFFMERLTEEINRSLRTKKDLSLLMIDIDYFKKYNDTFGHMAGDIVLKSVGLILSECFRGPGNIVCRYGGEEFVVALVDCPKEQALKWANEVRIKIRTQNIILRKQVTHVAVSVGMASLPADTQLREDLIGKADEALYRAKTQGRDRVCQWE